MLALCNARSHAYGLRLNDSSGELGDILEVIPDSTAQLLLVKVEELELIAAAVQVMDPDAQQVSMLVGAPCPTGLCR